MRYRFWLAGCVAGVLLPVAQAQQPTPAKTVDKQAMYEDVETLRRILNRELHAPRPSEWWLPSDGWHAAVGSECTSCHSTSVWPHGPGGGGSSAPRGSSGEYTTIFDFQSPSSQANTITWQKSLSPFGGLTWQTPAAQAANQTHRHQLTTTAPAAPVTFEGVYLKGHGVAYTATLSPAAAVGLATPRKSPALVATCGQCHESGPMRRPADVPAGPTVREPSVWDRVRAEVQGTPQAPAAKPAERLRRQEVCTPGSIAEQVLEILAEYGHNFRQLPAAEHISVVVTLPAEAAAAPAATGASEAPAAVRTARQLLDLAELHLKQGKHDEGRRSAIEAARRLTAHPLTFPADAPADTVRKTVEDANRILRGCYTLMAQAMLAAGNVRDAREALEKAQSAAVAIAGRDKPGKAEPAAAAPALPRKLVVSVSKQLLDRVHAGQVDAEQFRKAAEVEGVSLTVPAKK